jgi:hypothetical protein
MTYLGNTPTTQSFISGTDYFNGTGSQTAFTLSRTVASINDIQVTVNNVVQQPNDAYTISGTTLTMTSAPSVGTNNVYVRYLSTTTQAITPSQNTVSWNTLDSNIQQDLGVMFKNRIINGNMAIDQRNAGASLNPADGAYSLDRWKCAVFPTTGKYTIQQDAGAVTPPVGFSDYLGITSSSAYTSGSTDQYFINQRIEGFNWADLGWGTANAKTVTLSFWARSSLTGTFAGSIINSAGNRSYPFTYTINAANTWEYETITITGETSGSWGTTNNIGALLVFNLGCGSSTAGTAGAWVSAERYTVTGSTNLIATNGATLYITGVQLEVGTQATAFTTAGGSYGAELALCQRYYQTSYQGSAVGSATTTNAIGFWYASTSNYSNLVVYLRTTMRSQPTVTLYSPVTGASSKMDVNFTGDVNANAQYLSSNAFQAYINNVSVAAGTNTQFHYAASIEL